MNNQISYFINQFSVYSPIIGILIAAILISKLSKEQWLIAVLLMVSLLTDIITTYFLSGNNYVFIHGYFILYIGIVYWVFSLGWKLKKHLKITGIILLELAVLVDMLFIGSYRQFDLTVFGLIALLFIIFSFYYFYRLYLDSDIIELEQSSRFWFVNGILFYSAGAFFSFNLAEYILHGPLPWTFHNISNILKNTLFAVGLWKARVVR